MNKKNGIHYIFTFIVRCDEEGEPIRDSNGKCMRCKPGEPGVFIGKIKRTSVANDFAGYSDKVRTYQTDSCQIMSILLSNLIV